MHAVRVDSRDEIRQLTGLRGIAALVVAARHFNFHDGAFLDLWAWNNLAVDVFFCLSAFTLSLVYRAGEVEPLPTRRYGAARFARIVPVYLLAFILSAASIRFSSSYGAYPAGDFVSDFLRQLLMVNAWPVIGSGVFWNAPGWSLSVEVFCYIFVFPALFMLSRRMLNATEGRKAAFLLCAGFVNALVYVKFFNADIFVYGRLPRDFAAVHWVAVIRGASMFAAGWIAWLSVCRQDKIARFSGAAVDAIALAMLLIGWAHAAGYLDDHFIVTLVPFFLIGLTMKAKSLSSRALSLGPVVWLGRISYSLYILHWIVKSVLLHAWPGLIEQSDWVSIPLCLAASILVAAASYYLLENPSRRILRRVLSGESRA